MTSRDPEPGAPEAPPRWPWQVLPLALLIIAGLAGLRGTVAAPHWDGPLRRDGAAVGAALEAVLAILLVITLRRRAAARRARAAARRPPPAAEVADKLRAVLAFVLGAGMLAVAVTLLAALHLHVFTAAPAKALSPARTGRPRPAPTPAAGGPGLHIPLAAVLYALLVLVLLAGAAVSAWWLRRLAPPQRAREDELVAEEPADLREAVESGRSALRALDDARASIIACYLAMEDSLADRGTARGAADTPDELLARAVRSGVVRGGAAARLTALFYEARFSSHPLGGRQRDEAARALDELAATLAEADA